MTGRLLAMIATVMLLALASRAGAQHWPERPVKVIVPFAAVGYTDGVGRIASEWLANKLGQSFVVENLLGAGGVIAAKALARAPADGYTIMTMTLPQIAIAPALDLPSSVRDSGAVPWRLAVAPDDLAGGLADATKRIAAEHSDGQVAVIVPAGRLDEFGKAVVAAVPGAAVGEHSELERPVVVLTVAQAKGLDLTGQECDALVDYVRALPRPAERKPASPAAARG